MKYAKLTAAGAFEYAPSTLPSKDGGVIANPSARDYLDAGWKPVLSSARPPVAPPREGWSYVRSGWREATGAIVPRWTLVKDAPPPPRVYSKLKVVAALTEAGVWPQVKAWIEANSLYDLYLAAQEFAEDNAWFAQGLAALKPVVGWTDEQVEALLAKCVKEG